MRIVFRMSAIVAALALAAAALGGCGQRGPLYLPTVPPLPNKPAAPSEPPPSDVKPDAEMGAIPASTARGPATNTSSAPLSLSPDYQLRAAPGTASPAQGPAENE
jgi:predicted small lipoprotein YifL